MKVHLLKGSFSPLEIERIVTELIQVKIKFHESKIKDNDDEETIKMRENRIIKLQNELVAVRKYLASASSNITAEAEINLS